VGISKSDIFDVASAVKTLLQSDENKRYLHGLLFDFYSDFVPPDGDTPGISQAVLGDYFSFGLTKELRRLERKKEQKKELDEKDRERLQELPAEIQKIKDAANKRDNTIAHRSGMTKALIPDLIVETIEQKATVVLAYYYHWLVEHEHTEKELQQLHEEWPKSKPPPVPPDAKETPVPTAIGFQFFVDECSEVENIILRGHQRVEKWVNEVTESCEQAVSLRIKPAGRKADHEKLALALQTHETYSYDKEQARAVGAPFYKPHWAKENSITLVELNRRLALARYHLKKE
jgi:hypothetical protein